MTDEDPNDAIDITADEFLAAHQGFHAQEKEIGSLQGALRKEIGEEWKGRNVHRKAMSHMRVGMKITSEQGRIHYFKSVLAIAEDLLAHCEGQGTAELEFEEGET